MAEQYCIDTAYLGPCAGAHVCGLGNVGSGACDAWDIRTRTKKLMGKYEAAAWWAAERYGTAAAGAAVIGPVPTGVPVAGNPPA